MCCRHHPRYPDVSAVPSIDAALACCTIVDGHQLLAKHPRAVTVPDGMRTMLDGAFWKGCSPCQRACVLAHERAHTIIGMDCPCESCADKVGGFLMRVWGYTCDAIETGFRSLRVDAEPCPGGGLRDAPAGAAEGAREATRCLAARGLLGTVPTRERLLAGVTRALDGDPSGRRAPATALPPAQLTDHAAAQLDVGSIRATSTTRPASKQGAIAASKQRAAPPGATAAAKSTGAPVSVVGGAPADGGVRFRGTDPRPSSDGVDLGSDLARSTMIQVAIGIIAAIVVAVVIGR